MSALPAGRLAHFPSSPRVVATMPGYVEPSFAGRCKVFPAPTSNGKCPFLLGYQADWVNDDSRLKVMEKGRQIGLTWSTAYRAVRKCGEKEAQRDWWISSRDDIQAKLFLMDCKPFAEVFNFAATDLGERIIDEDGHSASVLRFANGRAINSMSSNPNAQAGKRGPRVLDEFALHPDPRKLYDIAYPGITWGGSLEIVSTHRGSQNFFNGLLREAREKQNPKGWSIHSVTVEDALAHGFLYKLQSKLPPGDTRLDMDEATYFDFIRSGCSDEESFMQEFMCSPGDDASAFLSYDLIAGCWHKSQADWRIERISYDKHGKELPQKSLGEWKLEDATGPLYIGYDVGRRHDLTVVTVSELLGGRLHIRLIIEMERTPFARQEAELFPLLHHPRFVRCCGDATGIGAQLAERAQAIRPGHVEAVVFTVGSKDELATPMRPAFEDKSIVVPDDGKLTSDLRAIRKLATSTGAIRFDGERGANGHSDRFWSIALSKHAAKSGAGDNYRIFQP